ncbi:unnamed protein product [Caenorhabditis angaria]|uniref:Serine protease n=1 Tax=Caenorhabditis angaria TaxID=860376 RepID=A0A9P1N3J8_9PELO|nr:unnamed protein product [Caenorhabditis angaria]
MNTYISVTGQNGKVLEIYARNGIIGEPTLRSAFFLRDDTPICLMKNNLVLERRCDDPLNPHFNLLDNWNESHFELRWKESRRSNPVNTLSHSEKQALENEKIDKIIEQWEHRVFLIEGEQGVHVSGVLISDQRILTAGHINFKINATYKVRGTKYSCENVVCEFVSDKCEFAVLKSTELPEYYTRRAELNRGNKFVIMGYPFDVSKPSVSKGIIEGGCVPFYGLPEFETGYSGGPVFNMSGDLTGILIGTSTREQAKAEEEEEKCILSFNTNNLLPGKTYCKIMPYSGIRTFPLFRTERKESWPNFGDSPKMTSQENFVK